MACDICGKVGTELHSLLSQYQTTQIKAVCPECARILDERLYALQDVSRNIARSWFRSFLEARAATFKRKEPQHDNQD